MDAIIWRIGTLCVAFALCLIMRPVYAGKPRCHIKCGVVMEKRGPVSLKSFVGSVWSDLRYQRGLSHMDLQLEDIEPRTEKTMSELLQAYINIGSSNASVVLGTYLQPIATATERHGVPYFVISDVKEGQYKPYNLISISPKLLDIYAISVDLVRYYNWDTVAVFYENLEGLFLLEKLILNPGLHVRAWKIDGETGSEAIRQHLLEIRQMSVNHVIIMTSKTMTNLILQQRELDKSSEKTLFDGTTIAASLQLQEPFLATYNNKAEEKSASKQTNIF